MRNLRSRSKAIHQSTSAGDFENEISEPVKTVIFLDKENRGNFCKTICQKLLSRGLVEEVYVITKFPLPTAGLIRAPVGMKYKFSSGSFCIDEETPNEKIQQNKQGEPI